MKEDKPNYYAIIPAEIRYDNDLTPNEKILYGEITALTNQKGECWATNSYFSNLYKVKIQSVSRWLRHLKERKYIDIDILYKENTKEIEKRIIKISGTPLNKNVKTYPQNSNEGINKNVKENNTSINNIKEIYKEKKAIDYFNGNEELNILFNDFLEMRKGLKAKNTDRAINLLLNFLSNYNDHKKKLIIERSIVNSWKGLFALKEDPKKREVKYLW